MDKFEKHVWVDAVLQDLIMYLEANQLIEAAQALATVSTMLQKRVVQAPSILN